MENCSGRLTGWEERKKGRFSRLDNVTEHWQLFAFRLFSLTNKRPSIFVKCQMGVTWEGKYTRNFAFIFVIPYCHPFSWPLSILHLRMRQYRGWSCDNTQESFHCQSATRKLYLLATWWIKIRYFRFMKCRSVCKSISIQRESYLWRGWKEIIILKQLEIRSVTSLKSLIHVSCSGKRTKRDAPMRKLDRSFLATTYFLQSR